MMNYGNISQGNHHQKPQSQQQYGDYHQPQQQHGWEQQQPQHYVENANRHRQAQLRDQFQQQNLQSLPPGWIEATDPNSGKLYYCNPQTGETKWERPTLFSTNETVQTGTTPAVTAEDQNVQQHQNAQPLPPGWVEARDPSSGKVYYCNPTTRETKWERPSFTSSTPSATFPTGVHGEIESSGIHNVESSGFNSSSNINSSNKGVLGGDSASVQHGIYQSTTPSTIATTITPATQKSGEEEDFDELQCITTGQIAHLIKVQQRQQKEELSALTEDERQVDLSTIVTNNDKNNAAALDRFKYAPIELSTMSLLSITERTEPGRLDVRMHALREELKKFGYQQPFTQPKPYL